MISAKELQRKYRKLYVALRNYIWPFRVIEYIADLEIAVYQTFPDIFNVKIAFNVLRINCLRLVPDDEEMIKAFDAFEELLESEDTLYAKLDTRQQGVER